MNLELRQIFREINLADPSAVRLQYEFCYFCASRIAQNLESIDAIGVMDKFRNYMAGNLDPFEFEAIQRSIFEIAGSHQGSKSLDGTQHAAVSATYALANAINGNMIAAAEYAAYSKVYGYGGYAVNDPENYKEEYGEQVKFLRLLLGQYEKLRRTEEALSQEGLEEREFQGTFRNDRQ